MTRPGVAVEANLNRQNLFLLVTLRWLAVGGQLAAIAFACFWVGADLPIATMSAVILLLVLLNLMTLGRLRAGRAVSHLEILIELLLDVAALTAQLYFSGGATNPFVSLFLLQAILGAVLLDAWATWTIVAVASLCFIGLMVAYRPIRVPMPVMDGSDSAFRDLHVHGMFICFLLAAVLLVFFVTRINQNLREQDRRLARLRQQSSEEAHVVRMGLLASGAAHELGTPLATISVILNDWDHMSAAWHDTELIADLAEMQSQVARCKEIVSAILRSAGTARGEDAEATSLMEFLDETIGDWEQNRGVANLGYDNRLAEDVIIASDALLRQVLFNVLDNALEASPKRIEVLVSREGEALVIAISDAGHGFSEAILSEFGQPYQSTKSQPGRGLGLFLAVNVLRKLGGQVLPANLPGGGALVQLRIPIAALAVEAGDAA